MCRFQNIVIFMFPFGLKVRHLEFQNAKTLGTSVFMAKVRRYMGGVGRGRLKKLWLLAAVVLGIP